MKYHGWRELNGEMPENLSGGPTPINRSTHNYTQDNWLGLGDIASRGANVSGISGRCYCTVLNKLGVDNDTGSVEKLNLLKC